MEFQVNTNNVILAQINQVESGEYNVTECRFNFSSEYEGLTKTAVFTGANGDTYKITILNNKCEIPSELLTESQIVQIGVYAYEVQGTEFVLRYSPMPTRFMIEKGSYVVNAVNMSRPTPTEVEQLQSQITHNANDIEDLQQTVSEHTTDISNIQSDINDIKAEQTEQNTKIQKNTDDIIEINQNINEIDSHINAINEDIDNLEQDLTNYSLITETGSQINLNINSTNYQITAILKDKNGNVIYTSNAIDLPIESMIVNARYDNTTKEIVLTLQNGNTLRISIADLVSGLVSETQLQTILTNYYTKTEVDNLLSNLAGRVSTNEEDIADIKEEQTTQNTNIEELQSQVETLQEDLESANSEIEELNTDITNMAKAMYKVEGQGTDITLENTSENKFVEFGLEGNTEQEQLTGKNLVNVADRTINASGYDQYLINNYDIDNSKNYTISFDYEFVNTSFSSTGAIIMLKKDSNYTSLVASTASTTGHITASISGTSKLGLYVTNRFESGTIKIKNVMLEEGSTATSYEPYCGGIPSPNPDFPQQIKNVTGQANVKIQNKNLFDIGTQKSDYSKQEVINEFIENGIKFNVIDYGNTVTYRLQNLEGNKQYVLTALSSVAKGRFYIRIRSQDDSRWLNNNDINLQASGWSYVSGYNGWYLTFNSTTMSKVITIPECLYWQLGLGFESASSIVGTIQIISNIQLEQGSTATSYVEHQEQNYPLTLGDIELCKIDTAQDYFYKENNKWYLHKEIDKVVFNGSSNVDVWGNATRVGTSSFYRFANSAFNDTTKYKSLTPYISDKFIFDNVNSLQEKNVISNTSATGLNRLWITIDTTLMNGATVEDFKTWLSTHNTEVYYQLATPTDIEITETTLINQLEAIEEAHTYEDITYITSESDELGFNMNAVAVADANKVIENQNSEIDTIKSRLDLLEG